MKQTSIIPKYVENTPETLNEGVLYICERYHIAAHKCCCGCDQEVITPLSRADWLMHKENDLVTLFPSIGNWSFRCQSHYWIKKNKVIWSFAMTKKEIEHVRARDKADKEAYITSINSSKQKTQKLPTENIAAPGFANKIMVKLLRTIKNWWA